MSTTGVLPSSLRKPSILGDAAATRSPRKGGRRIRLGNPGRCPKTPTLTMFICDDSGSLYGPAGSDPLSNRYGEVHRALEAVARHCFCGKCQAAIIHFDTPTTGCVDPTPLTRTGMRRLANGLTVPHDATGASLLEGSLTQAEALAAHYPDHPLALCILTDWELFDDNASDLFSRLASYPGKVYAVGLRNPPPLDLLGPATQTVTVTRDSPQGSLACAMFDSLTIHRSGRALAA
ncbi:hypothetical protein OOZ51_00305 [Arthrobacter sp. MI7-26]|uniref:hypothetical protein n=1 Tax=Arthrobacter sp. MI7-26 TaxID=2993653 RepID=UPI002248FAA2|nr:hypothetical protein [Arthrobacter sp. MI7-26]MCX2746254.1 hypothetical protein [Arthrobacter sp. MI7-26]